MKKNKLVLLILVFLAGCARGPIKDRTESMRKAKSVPDLTDDLDFNSLKQGILSNVEFIKKSSRVPPEIPFGPVKIEKKKYISALEHLANSSDNIESFKDQVRRNFDFYEVYGNEDWAQIKATSYFSPLLKGSTKKTKQLSQALYSTPEDMIYIDIDAFAEDFPKWKTFKDQILDQRNSKSTFRARFVNEKKCVRKSCTLF
jgi:membrane-bound lytic murein transglycosylase A